MERRGAHAPSPAAALREQPVRALKIVLTVDPEYMPRGMTLNDLVRLLRDSLRAEYGPAMESGLLPAQVLVDSLWGWFTTAVRREAGNAFSGNAFSFELNRQNADVPAFHASVGPQHRQVEMVRLRLAYPGPV